jgi:endonuclease/exonuclease/phosphatase family metal-dependent hydrolase
VQGCLVIAALLLSSACAATRPPDLPTRIAGQDVVLAVVAWNMNAGRGDLPRLVDDLASGRLTGVPVQRYVLLLQEAIEGSDHDVVRFGRARGLSAFFVPLWESDRGVSGNAIVSTSRLLNARAIELPRERRVRRAVAATVEVGGARLFTTSVHLENRLGWLRGGVFGDAARGRQAAALLNALPDGPGIVGGDLNTLLGPDEPAWQALESRFVDTPAHPLEPTFRDRLVLDHLFFDLPDGWHAAREVVADRYGSDHHPVLGVVFGQQGRQSE